MLIKALCDYYDVLAKNEKVLQEGYSNVKVHYLVSLTLEGDIDEIINWQESEQVENGNGKIKERLIPRTIVMPERTEKPGIDANIVEHRPLYIFGLNFDKESFSTEDRTGKAKSLMRHFGIKIWHFWRDWIQRWLMHIGRLYPVGILRLKQRTHIY